MLVRPDAYVAWRRRSVAEDCAAELSRVMDEILGFEQPPGEGVARTTGEASRSGRLATASADT